MPLPFNSSGDSPTPPLRPPSRWCPTGARFKGQDQIPLKGRAPSPPAAERVVAVTWPSPRRGDEAEVGWQEILLK